MLGFESSTRSTFGKAQLTALLALAILGACTDTTSTGSGEDGGRGGGSGNDSSAHDAGRTPRSDAGADVDASRPQPGRDADVMSMDASDALDASSAHDASDASDAPDTGVDAAADSGSDDGDAGDELDTDASVPGLPQLSVSNESGAESASALTFTLTLSKPTADVVSVDCATYDVSASSGSGDYSARSQHMVFGPYQTTATLQVGLHNDGRDEHDETFAFECGNPVNAVIASGKGVGTGTIVDDDAAPSIEIYSAGDVVEGGTATFYAQLSEQSEKTITVDVGPVDGSAKAPGDYLAASLTLTFYPGSTLQSYTMKAQTESPTLFEATESMSVQLSNPTNATIGTASASLMIFDIGTLPLLYVNDVTHDEGNSGNTSFTFDVSLNLPSAVTTTVQYFTATTGAAIAGGDYDEVSGTLTFLPGVTTQSVTINVHGDTLHEASESFGLNLQSAVNAGIYDAQAIGSIVNDDGPPYSIQIRGGSAQESAASVSILVSLSAVPSSPVTVQWTTVNGSAIAGQDYVAASGTLTFNSSTSRLATISVDLINDSLDEANEAFGISLPNVTGDAVFENSSASIEIVDND